MNADLNIRPLKLEDAEMVFGWRNDPYIANLGSLQRKVTWEEHLNWFKDTISGSKRKAYILEINSVASGQVRFDLKTEDSCVISVYLLKEFSGKGYGISFITMGCKKIFSEWEKINKIFALVRKDNSVGQKAFLKAGFEQDNSITDENHIVFSLDKTMNLNKN